MTKMKLTAKLALVISGSYSLIFVSFCFYKGIVLYFVNKAMEDTFVGGETSDISIFFMVCNWGVIIILFFFIFLLYKNQRSQKSKNSFKWN